MPPQQKHSTVQNEPRPFASPSCRICGSREVNNTCNADGYDFYRCSYCHFVFCPALDQEYINNLYRSGYHNPEDGTPDRGWAKRLSFLNPALQLLEPQDAEILDFGCGESKIPDVLRERGYDVTGVDMAPPVRKQENRLTGNILDLHLSENEFDLVYSFQVFEHLPEPVPVLDELFRITRPGGYLLIHTDMEVPERFEQGFSNWWYVTPPDHCVFFRHRTFEVCLQERPHRMVYKDPKTVMMEKGMHQDGKQQIRNHLKRGYRKHYPVGTPKKIRRSINECYKL